EEAVLIRGCEIPQVEVIGFGQPQQDLRGHRALVPFNQVDVTGRNAEPFRNLGLGEAKLLPDAAKARADEKLSPGIGRHDGALTWSFVTNLTELQIRQVNMLHDITIRMQDACTNYKISRLSLVTHLQCIVKKVDWRMTDGENL